MQTAHRHWYWLWGFAASGLLATCFLPHPAAWAQVAPAPAAIQVAAPTESAIKAAFLYKFGAFVDWPTGTFKAADETMVIGVAGDDAVRADLERLVAGRRVEGRPVKVVRIGDLPPPSGVHILFLGQQREDRLRESLEASSGPLLLVTALPGALRFGSIINFSTDTGKVRFSVSLTAAEARSLKLSARLLAVAQSVEGNTR
jgi:hypothetical protein